MGSFPAGTPSRPLPTIAEKSRLSARQQKAPQRKRSLRLPVTGNRRYVERNGVVDVYEVRKPTSSPYDVSYESTSGVGAHILEGTGIQIVIAGCKSPRKSPSASPRGSYRPRRR